MRRASVLSLADTTRQREIQTMTETTTIETFATHLATALRLAYQLNLISALSGDSCSAAFMTAHKIAKGAGFPYKLVDDLIGADEGSTAAEVMWHLARLTPVTESTDPTVTKEGSTTLYRNLKDRDGRFLGKERVGRIYVGQHADVTPGHSIRLHGLDANYRHDPKDHDITFVMGQRAVYDSYNLFYTGEIVKITAKTVTIDSSATGNSGNTKRLSISEFNRRNNHYDAEAIAKRNGEWTD